MKFLHSLLLGSALAVAPVAALAQSTVSEINVNVDLSAASNANALEFWPNLEADLASRLATALAGNIADDGGRLQVTVGEVSVDGNALLAGAGEFNTLSGSIALYPTDVADGDTPAPALARAAVRAVPELAATTPLPDGPVLILSPTDGTVYNAMLDKFAEVVADRVNAM